MSRLGSHGGSGIEGRIRADFKVIRNRQRQHSATPVSGSSLMMRMAQRWKMPIREIRRILDKPSPNKS